MGIHIQSWANTTFALMDSTFRGFTITLPLPDETKLETCSAGLKWTVPYDKLLAELGEIRALYVTCSVSENSEDVVTVARRVIAADHTGWFSLPFKLLLLPCIIGSKKGFIVLVGHAFITAILIVFLLFFSVIFAVRVI